MSDQILIDSLPMVNETNLSNFFNKYVIVHGKVSNVKSGTLFLCINPDTSTDVIIKNFKSEAKIGSNIKVIGKVYHDKSIEFLDAIPLDDKFDLKLLNDTIPILSHREVANMFYNQN
jgi:hypothetical protein